MPVLRIQREMKWHFTQTDNPRGVLAIGPPLHYLHPFSGTRFIPGEQVQDHQFNRTGSNLLRNRCVTG